MTNEVATVPQQDLRPVGQRLTPAQIKADYEMVKTAIGSCMEIDKDYGVIPGTPKPTLYKPGSEKLMLMFRLASRPLVEDLSNPDEIRYRVQTEIIHHPSGTVVAYGVGEASSNEAKYKWKKAYKREWDDTPEDRRRKKYGEDRNGKEYEILQVRTEPADLANTILKMADKRSVISGVLKATAASAIFTQDLEDFDQDLRQTLAEADETVLPPIKEPKRKTSAPAAAKPAAAPAQESKPEGQPAAAAQEAPQGGTAKAPAHFIAMNAKKDGPCGSCADPVAKGEAIWFDKKDYKAHHRGHFA